MKKHLSKILTSFLLVMALIFTAIPLASASTLLDESKKGSISMTCDKPGYTFTVYNVATLDSTSTSPYETAYKSLVPSISNSILSGDTKGILKALDSISSMPSTAKSVGTFTTSQTSTSKNLTNLEHGIYYIKATNFPAGVKSVTNSVIALPYFNGADWIYDSDKIVLAEKVVDDVPVTEKTITNSTKNNVNYTDVSLGDTVDFEIRSTTAGSSEMKLKSYAVYDDMSAGLTLDKNSFNVALLKQDGTKIADLESTDYTVTVTSESEGKNTLFNVALTNAYLQKEDFYAANVYYTSVTYSAVLNKYAVVGVAGNPNTEQKLVYSNKNGVTDEVEANTVYVYTYAAMTNKTDPDGKPLEGGEFKLYKTEKEAQAQKNEIATGVSDKYGKVIYYNANGEEMKLASGDYYVFETKAPKGYTPYGKVIKISIKATYGDTFVNGTYVTNSPKDGYASIDVPNVPIIAPQTGGIGTGIFYLLGACSLTGAAFLFFVVFKKRKKN